MIIDYPDYSSFDSFLEYFDRVNELAVKEFEIQYFIDHDDERTKRTTSIVETRDLIIKDASLDFNSRQVYVTKLEESLKKLGFYGKSAALSNAGANANYGHKDDWKAEMIRTFGPAVLVGILSYKIGEDSGMQKAFSIMKDAKETAAQIAASAGVQNQANQGYIDAGKPTEILKTLMPVFEEVTKMGERLETVEKRKGDARQQSQRMKVAKKIVDKYMV